MPAHVEIERTYGPEPGTPLPDLRSLPGVERVADPRVDDLEATYFDTDDLVLVRAGVSLRRRTGGTDEGWHLKVPSEGARVEIRLPLARAVHQPPRELRDSVLGWTRGAPLEHVATIRTRRTTHALLDRDGHPLAELADDEVDATRADGERTQWHEWEVELVDGEEELLAAADDLMSDHGVHRGAVDRKVARALGDRIPEPMRLRRPKPGKPVARAVHARLAAQVEELAGREVLARRGDPEGVHKARVACRRLRAALATFRPFLDREVTEPLRDDLRWVARSLGEVRDTTVVHERLRSRLGAEPRDLVAGPVARRLRSTYGGRPDSPAALSDPRYLELRRALDRLVADPPWTERAGRAARKAMRKRLRKEVRRVMDRHDDDVETCHDLRKAAKRLRYAAEAAEPVLGKEAKRLAKGAKSLTSHLGERQDTVATREQLVELARAARDEGEPTFTYGRLHAREEARAAELDAGFPEEWRRFTALARRWTC